MNPNLPSESRVNLIVYLHVDQSYYACYLTAKLETISEVTTSVLQHSSQRVSAVMGPTPTASFHSKMSKAPSGSAKLGQWSSITGFRGCSYNRLTVRRTERSVFVFKYHHLSSRITNWYKYAWRMWSEDLKSEICFYLPAAVKRIHNLWRKEHLDFNSTRGSHFSGMWETYNGPEVLWEDSISCFQRRNSWLELCFVVQSFEGEKSIHCFFVFFIQTLPSNNTTGSSRKALEPPLV